jgi:hypothetical protein
MVVVLLLLAAATRGTQYGGGANTFTAAAPRLLVAPPTNLILLGMCVLGGKQRGEIGVGGGVGGAEEGNAHAKPRHCKTPGTNKWIPRTASNAIS